MPGCALSSVIDGGVLVGEKSTRERMIDSAIALIQRNGAAAVTVDAVLADTRIDLCTPRRQMRPGQSLRATTRAADRSLSHPGGWLRGQAMRSNSRISDIDDNQ